MIAILRRSALRRARDRALRGHRAELRHAGNFFEITRLSVELGLLAIALTPVIVTGGIDLSVGAMMGLAAVVFGAACRDWGLHPAVAALIALAGAAPAARSTPCSSRG